MEDGVFHGVRPESRQREVPREQLKVIKKWVDFWRWQSKMIEKK
jgi:hypothetical protein